MKTTKKNGMICFSLFLLLAGVFFMTAKDTQAASKKLNILNSYDRKSCQADLDGDGKKEKLKLKVSRNEIGITKVILQVNGNNALNLQNSDLANAHTVIVDYVSMTKTDIFVRVTISGDNDFIYLDNFYCYNPATQKMVKAVQLLDTKGWGATGTITGVSSSGIKMSYRYQFAETGAIKWTNTYIAENKKLKLKSKSASAKSVYTLDYDPDGYSSLFVKNQFKVMKSLTLYTDTSTKQVSFTAKKDEILTLKKIKYTGGNFYLQFSKGNKNGWLKLDLSNYKPVFYGVENRLAG